MEDEIKLFRCSYTVYGYYNLEIKISGPWRTFVIPRPIVEDCIERYVKRSGIQLMRPLSRLLVLMLAGSLYNGGYRIELNTEEDDGKTSVKRLRIRVATEDNPAGLHIDGKCYICI